MEYQYTSNLTRYERLYESRVVDSAEIPIERLLESSDLTRNNRVISIEWTKGTIMGREIAMHMYVFTG